MTADQTCPVIATLAQLRADIAIAREYAYFQTASHGPVPGSIQQFIADMMREENSIVLAGGGPVRSTTFGPRSEDARRVIAGLLSVVEDELAWAYNTTTATRLAVRSLDWKPGDRLALTDIEHASTRELCEALESIVGVRATVVPTGPDSNFSPEYFLERLGRLLTSDHRLLIMSHVANTDGRRLPIREAAQIARVRGVPTLVDGAQAVGVFPVNVAELGVDFYSGSVHKWLLGPAGVGFLVVRRDRLPHYNPNFMPLKHDASQTLTSRDAAAGWLSELGTPNAPLRMAGAHCVELARRIGFEVIEEQIKTLASRLHDGLRVIPGVRVAGPRAWELSSGITGVQFPGRSTQQILGLVTRLREERRICTKFRPEIQAMRVATAPFNTVEEVDRLLQALAEFVPEM